MTLAVSPDVNPDANGRPSPVVVHVYQLRADGAFRRVEFFELMDDSVKALGEVLISLGHRRIGVITGTGRGNYSGPAEGARILGEPSSVHRNRVLGLQDALAAIGVNDLPVEERPDNSATAGADALPIWSDTRDPDLFLCPGTGTPGNPPDVCLGVESAGPQAGLTANDEDIFTAGVVIPNG